MTEEAMRVEKRDGRIVDFDRDNIRRAISSAFRDLGREIGPQESRMIDDMSGEVESEASGRFTEPIRIEDIQNLVEHALIDNHLYDVARAYTQYRLNRDIDRARSTDVNEAVSRFMNRDESIAHENANKDSNVYATQRDLLAGTVSKAMALNTLPTAVANAHRKGDIHFHDLDYSPFTAETNCSLPNFADMLAHGFALGNAMMDSPKSIGTATTQITQIIKDIAGCQYGGQTVNRADEMLERYARLDYDKALEDAHAVIPDDMDVRIAREIVESLKRNERKALHFTDDRPDIPESEDAPFHHNDDELDDIREVYAKLRTRKAIYDAMQTMEYQINSNRVSNGQTPFVTVGFGLGTSWFSREIQRAIFLIRIAGLGSDHQTAIFPKLVFTIRHGVNADPDDPNYDLKQLALECATKRMYPDIVFYENIVRLTGSFKAPMGCVAGHELVTWTDGVATHTEGIGRMWRTLSERYPVKRQDTGNAEDLYIDLPERVKIRDSHTGTPAFVPVRRMIRNASRGWLRVTFDNGRMLDCTPDHPLSVEGRGRVYARDLSVGDRVSKTTETRSGGDAYWNPNKAWLMGLLLCDGCYAEPSEVLVSFAAAGEEEIAQRIETMYPASALRHKLHERGRKGTYREIAIKDSALNTDCVREFDGTAKIRRRVPDGIFGATREERISFLAGMIDADGYLNARSQHIQLGSTNRELALGQMLLAESLGYDARVYMNHYKTAKYEAIRYRVEFRATQELVDSLACSKKRDNFNPAISRHDFDSTPTVRSVVPLDMDEPSFDVTTVSDYFDVSGVVSHNCRSFLQAWTDPETGEDVEDGRMNLGVVTVNVPRIAIESHGDKDRFWKLFNERMEIAHQALQFRIMRCKQATPVNAPTLFRFGAFGRLGANDNVDQLFKNERATVSLGYIGLYEATAVFYGKNWMRDHGWDPEGKDFALSIVKRMNELCKQWSTAEGYHYSVYSTPAESLTDRFNRMDREKYGEIEGVTDHDFYTNSFHYPVWLQPTPMEKLTFEKDFPYYASGGFINYCEYPCLQDNPKALEAVWDYAYNIGIGYLGTNTPIDHCFVCGFQGDFEPTDEGFKCPECGNSDPDKCNVTKRTCGYLGNPVQRPMVHGRHEEISHRVKHMSGETGHVILADGSTRDWWEETR